MSPSVSRITRNPVRTRVWSSARSTRILAVIPTIVHVAAMIAGSSLRMTPGRNVILAPDDDYRSPFLLSVTSTTTHVEGKQNERHLQGNPPARLRAGRPVHRARGLPDGQEHDLHRARPGTGALAVDHHGRH